MIIDELIDYAEKCISGDILSCKKHKWACMRFLRDVDNAGTEKFPYLWNEEAAQRIVDWYAELYHSKGVLAGQPINLHISQKFSRCQIFGWVHMDTGLRRFRYSFKEVARKNAKTQEESGTMLYKIAVDSLKNGEVHEGYCAGAKHDQSKLAFDECINMLEGSRLKKYFNIKRNEIVHRSSNSFIRMLSKEDRRTGDGTNPDILLIDEYHQHPTTEFYDLFKGANTKEPLLDIITTAGVDLTYPCYTQIYDFVSKLLDPDCDTENDTYFADVFEIDDDDDESDAECWPKANPVRMSYPEGCKRIEEEYNLAKDIPENMPMFLTKCLNRWVTAPEGAYMDYDKFKKCIVKDFPVKIAGMNTFIGFDMSAKIDLTSIAFVMPFYMEGVKKYAVISHSFAPSWAKLREREKLDKVPYTAWAMEGYITVTETEIVDQQQVMDYALNESKRMNLEIDTLCFDPANAGKLMMDLSNEGFKAEEVFQNVRSLNESTCGFREQVYEGNIYILYNPVFNFAIKNAVTRSQGGLIKIDKDANKKKIDPVDAALCGYKLALYWEPHDSKFIDEWLDKKW